MMIKGYKNLIKLHHIPMKQMHLKCVKVECYQRINGVLIKSYYLQKNIRVTSQICHKTFEGLLTAKLTSDNTNKIILSQDFGKI